MTLDRLTLQVSSAPLTLIHDACWDHKTANSLWPMVEGNELHNSPSMHMQSKSLRGYEESYTLIIVVVFEFRAIKNCTSALFEEMDERWHSCSHPQPNSQGFITRGGPRRRGGNTRGGFSKLTVLHVTVGFHCH